MKDKTDKILFLLLFVGNAALSGYRVSTQNYGMATFCALVSIMSLFAAYERP